MRIDFAKKWRMPERIWKRLRKLIPHWHPSPKGGPSGVNERAWRMGSIMCCGQVALKAAPPQFGSGSSLHAYFQNWDGAGVFFANCGSRDCASTIDVVGFSALADSGCLDGESNRSEGEKTGPNPTDRGKSGTKRSLLTDGRGVVPVGRGVRKPS